MFDTIAGLPVHPLVVHAVVVLGPLTALLLLLYAVVRRWRPGLRWPVLIGAAVTAVCAFVATQSGEQLEHRIGDPAYDHAEKGDLAAIACYVLLGAAIVVVLLLCRLNTTGLMNVLGIVVAVLAVAFLTYAVINAGHSGAEAAWKDVIAGATG